MWTYITHPLLDRRDERTRVQKDGKFHCHERKKNMGNQTNRGSISLLPLGLLLVGVLVFRLTGTR